MPTQSINNKRRLIEDWLPVNEISIENIREGDTPSALPPINWLHAWWARRPLAVSRAAVAASVLNADAEHRAFYELMGTSVKVVEDRQRIEIAKKAGIRLKTGYTQKRAFTHNPTTDEVNWLKDNVVAPDPLVLDITAGGGSIPFEAGRLGLRSHANELNPVASLILHATCQWPQIYGRSLLTEYEAVSELYLKKVTKLLEGVYPEEKPPEWMCEWNEERRTEIESGTIKPAKRYVWSYLFARSIACPSCTGEIPLSPNWKLTSNGTGIRLLPTSNTSECAFKVVNNSGEQSPGTVRNGVSTCPYPQCGATTPKGFIADQAQAGLLGHRLYAVIMRDQWQEYTKSGRPKKRLTTKLHFRAARPEDDNTVDTLDHLNKLLAKWKTDDILPSEIVPEGNDRRPHTYGMSSWHYMFSPRQQLVHGYCVQVFQELVDDNEANGLLDDTRKAAWCYVSLALDKLLNYNSLLSFWHPRREVVANTFDGHDFRMRWSYAEMAIGVRGLGLEWALNDLGDCISKLVDMSGQKVSTEGRMNTGTPEDTHVAVPTGHVTTESADFLISVDDKSVDAIVFDPPYYDNVSYAELSDFFYVWLKRTAGYIYSDWFSDYLTDKMNEAIASPARFQSNERPKRGNPSAKQQSYLDYVDRMRNIFRECRRVIKDDGIMTIMFTHKSTEAWDALTIGIIEAGFRITATWPVKTESDSSLNIRDRAAARSTILLACRPKTVRTASSSSWEQVERQVASAVQKRIPELESYDLSPLDIYLASFGPALEVISSNWPIRRELANPERPNDPFGVTPNDALIVARREVFDARRQRISDLWANNPGDALTEFYILAQDNAGSATIPFDEANMMARCIGLELTDHSIYEKKGSNINLLTGVQRFARGDISPTAPTEHHIDRVHTAIALAESSDVNNAINWCRMQDFAENAAFKGTLEALLLVMKTNDPDMQPARNLWTEMYSEAIPEPEGVQVEMSIGTTASML